MEVTTILHPHCDLVVPNGRVDSLTAPRLAEAIKSITDAGRFHIVLDLASVSYVSSAGLRVLIDAQKTCKPHGGELALASVPKRIYETLDLAGLVSLFKLYDSATAAVEQ